MTAERHAASHHGCPAARPCIKRRTPSKAEPAADRAATHGPETAPTARRAAARHSRLPVAALDGRQRPRLDARGKRRTAPAAGLSARA